MKPNTRGDQKLGSNNWIELRGSEPEITPLAKGWFVFHFNCKSDLYFYLEKICNFGTTPFKLKKWSPLFDVDTKRLDLISV